MVFGERKFFIPVFIGILGFLGNYLFSIEYNFLLFGYTIHIFGKYIFFYIGIAGIFSSLYYFLKYKENNLAFLGLFFSLATILSTAFDIHIQPYDFSSGVITLEYFIFNSFLLSVFFIIIERFFPVKKQDILRNGWFLDVMYFFINRFSISFFIIFINLIIQNFFPFHIIEASKNFFLEINTIVQVVLILLISDFIYYWIHRMYHEIPFFWKFHTIHHSPEKLDWLAGTRVHLFEFGMTRIIITVPIILLGFTENSIMIYAFIVGVYAAFTHSNVYIPYSFLDKIFVTPRFHHWHHAKSSEVFYKNYGGQFVIYDILFGTSLIRDTYPETYGTFLGEKFPTDFLRQFTFPIFPKFSLKLGQKDILSKFLDSIDIFFNGKKEKLKVFVTLHKEKIGTFVKKQKRTSRKIIFKIKEKSLKSINSKKLKVILSKTKNKKIILKVWKII